MPSEAPQSQVALSCQCLWSGTKQLVGEKAVQELVRHNLCVQLEAALEGAAGSPVVGAGNPACLAGFGRLEVVAAGNLGVGADTPACLVGTGSLEEVAGSPVVAAGNHSQAAHPQEVPLGTCLGLRFFLET